MRALAAKNSATQAVEESWQQVGTTVGPPRASAASGEVAKINLQTFVSKIKIYKGSAIKSHLGAGYSYKFCRLGL
jgi:hypothetical protein